MRVGRPCTFDGVVDLRTDLVAVPGAPNAWAWTSGPNTIAWALRDYCHLAAPNRVHRAHLAIGEPFVKSCNGRVRDELFVEEFRHAARAPSRY